MRADHRFPTACPACPAVEGLPFKAETMANGSICVSLRCQACRHEWTLEFAADEVAVAPKPDRRHRRRS